jgi:hypothetical protein
VILLTAVVAGIIAGLLRARWQRTAWQPPEFRLMWLAVAAFTPQFFAFYFPSTRSQTSAFLAATCLVISQVGLLLFCIFNRRMAGIPILAIGLLLNLLVISANGGFMPLSTDTAAHLLPKDVLANLQIGARFGVSSKDILLRPEMIVFPWLADRFLPPDWFLYQFAFSLGDVLIGMGAFMLLVIPQKSVAFSQQR